MLIKTTEDLKRNFSSIDKDYKYQSLESFIDNAEKDILIPYIGQEIFDQIDAAYNSNQPLAGKTAALFSYLQKAVVNLALMLSADSGSFRISDSGFYVVSTATNKPVSDKKLTEFKKGRRESGYRAMEQAVVYLKKNVDDPVFSVYKASDAYLLHTAHFINDSVTFTRYYAKVANSAYLFTQLLDSLDFAERTNIAPVLGPEYFDALKSNFATGTATAAEMKLVPYINRALAKFTMVKALPSLPVEFEGTNLTLNSMPAYGNSENVVSKATLKADQLSILIEDALLTAKSELGSLEAYLIKNAGDLIGYTPPAVGEDFNINDPCSPTFFV
jgi:hypothetical protein